MQGTTLNGLSICYLELGQHVKAMEPFEQGLAMFKELGARTGQAATRIAIRSVRTPRRVLGEGDVREGLVHF